MINGRRFLLSFTLIILYLSNVGIVNGAHLAHQPPDLLPQTTSGVQTIYLPIVRIQFPRQVFGIEITGGISTQAATQVSNAGMVWTRHKEFSWEEIEPTRTNPPTYHWELVDETGLKNAAKKNLQLIMTIKYTPGWAQKFPGVSCGPISSNALSAFAQFLHALVARYSVTPYNIHYWELGNEPDIDPSLVPHNSNYGCWGNEKDAYYGGAYYAEMLKLAYPAIKAADPDAKVSIGGLLVDCDPDNPPAGKSCISARFLEGILLNQGSQYFDVLAYHAYTYYQNGKILDPSDAVWIKRGGVIMGKMDYLKQLMAKYQVSKPLMLTEFSLLCDDRRAECNPPGSNFYEAQADFAVTANARLRANAVVAGIWYQFEGPGWRYSGLLDSSQQPKPVYNAYKFMSQELSDALIRTTVAQYTNISGYEFINLGKIVWVLWATDQAPHTITLPNNVSRVLDKYGNPITITGGQLTIQSPVYIEFLP